MFADHNDQEPPSLDAALGNKSWCATMENEYQAFLDNIVFTTKHSKVCNVGLSSIQ
jgi:hypothetical protein